MYSKDEVIRSLYLGVLGREPDADGLRNYGKMLDQNAGSLDEIAEIFHASAEHTSVFNKGNVILDHSQYGEFIILLNHFVTVASKHKIIVDIGARGRERSNSYDLLKNFGFYGLLVEANPRLIAKIASEFAGTNCKLLNCAVSDQEGSMPFYIGANDDVSSLSRDSAANWGQVKDDVLVDVFRIGRILGEQEIPLDFDVLSLDIEGFDTAVINDMVENTQYRPGIVIIEASMDFKNTSILSAGMSAGVDAVYDLKYQTTPNMILVRK